MLEKVSETQVGIESHLGLTNFFQHSLAQSAIHIHTMHKADRRTTNDNNYTCKTITSVHNNNKRHKFELLKFGKTIVLLQL